MDSQTSGDLQRSVDSETSMDSQTSMDEALYQYMKHQHSIGKVAKPVAKPVVKSTNTCHLSMGAPTSVRNVKRDESLVPKGRSTTECLQQLEGSE